VSPQPGNQPSNRPANQPATSYPGLWQALNLALLWPGLGHYYAGQRARGLAWGIGMGILLAIVFWSFLGPTGNISIGSGALGIGILLWAVNVFDSLSCYRPYRPGKQAPIAKDPWYPILLSQCWPGLGHLYQQQHRPAAALLLTSGLLWILTTRWPLFGLPATCLTLIPCIHLSRTHLSSGHLNNRPSRTFLLALLICRLTIGSLPIAIHSIIEPFVVPSESMTPTLQIGDRLLVYKPPFRQYHPKQGDLIVFNSPDKRGQYFVKRIIGLPGDRIETRNHQLLRNNQPQLEPYLAEPIDYDLAPQTIPTDRLFVLGDNRNRSYDSHVWGSLDRDEVIGVVYRISWPPERNRGVGSRE
jgi:signal peptidase I